MRKGEVHVRLAGQSKDRIRKKLRRLTKRTRTGKLAEIIQEINQYTIGWMGYFRLAEKPSVYQALDE